MKILNINNGQIEFSSFVEIADPGKRETLCHLLDLIVEAATTLTIDDMCYLMVQLTFAQQHPVALQSRLQQVCDRHHPASDALQSLANLESMSPRSEIDLAPVGAVQPRQYSGQPESPLSDSPVHDGLS